MIFCLKSRPPEKQSFKVNIEVVKKHFLTVGGQKINNYDKMAGYLENFYNFCFELGEKDIIKGQINYKY